MKPSNTRLLTIAAAVAVVAATAAWYAAGARQPDAATAVADNTAPKGRKVLYWHDPMVPGFKSDKPGKSPFMDMELVPVYEDEAAGSGMPVVTIRPEVMNNLGVRTHQVKREARARTLVTHGYVFRPEGNSRLRVLVDVLDREADWVRPGLAAEVRLAALPSRGFPATVEQVQPDIDIGSRSLKAQVRMLKPEEAIKPNMFAEVVIRAPATGKRLAVPREALIRTGHRTAVVRALGDGRFQPVDVVAAAELGEWVEIQSGLAEGDTVVVSGQFLIDSESSLRASFSRMGAPANGGDGQPADHGSHTGHAGH